MYLILLRVSLTRSNERNHLIHFALLQSIWITFASAVLKFVPIIPNTLLKSLKYCMASYYIAMKTKFTK